MTTIPNKPPLNCPDCPGRMYLQKKPEHWTGGSVPFAYICENRSKGCKGLMSAHPTGDPMGTPAPANVRKARRHCHAVFDPLWKEAWKLPCYAENRDGLSEQHRQARITGAARYRTYAYVAHFMNMKIADCHISKITNIETLRQFWLTARGADPELIRDWWKEEGQKLYGKKSKRKAEPVAAEAGGAP